MSKTYTKTFTKIGYRAYSNDEHDDLSNELKEESFYCDDDIWQEKFDFARRRSWRSRFPLSINQRELIDELCCKYEWPGAYIAELKYTLPVEIVETTDEDGDTVYEALGQKFDDLDDIVDAIDWEGVDEEPELRTVEEWRPVGKTYTKTFTKTGFREVPVEIYETTDEDGDPVYKALGRKFDDLDDLADAIDWSDVEPEDED